MLIAIVTSPPPASYTSVILIAAAVLGGGLVPVLYQAYKNFRRGPIEDGAIIGKTIRDEMGNLKDLLGEYRLEMEVNKRQFEDYRQQFAAVVIELARAQVRIGFLEDRLAESKAEQEALKEELEKTKARRLALEAERDRLATEAAQLQWRIKALEDKAGLGDEPSD